MIAAAVSHLHSFVVWLTYPLALSACLLLLGMAAVLFRRYTLGPLLLLAGLGWSLLWSVPAFSDGLRQTLERQYPVVRATDLPRADAIVVLGGGGDYTWLDREDVQADDLGSSRLAAGARAWFAGRAPIIVLSGGRGRPGHGEARYMAAAIVRLGVPDSALVLEERSRTTRDNAVLTAGLLRQRGLHRILLVTSALHMPRAKLLFCAAGLNVVTLSVPERFERVGWRERWVPSRSALWRSGRAFKEYAGLLEAIGQTWFWRLSG